MPADQINLLHLLKSYDIGGIEKSTIRYSNFLVSSLHSVSILGSAGFLYQNKINTDKVNLCLFKYPINKNLFYYVLNTIRILKIIRSEKVNVINYHFRILIPAIWITRLFHPQIKLIYTAHSIFNDILNRFIIADNIIAVSNAVKSDISKYFPKKISVIYHGMESNSFQKPRALINKKIGYVGRLVEGKGIDLLLELFNEICTESRDYQLIIRGDGILKRYIQRFIKDNNIQKRVKILTPSNTKEEIYEDIDLLILPSTKLEGFGLVIIEAMSLGIPALGPSLKSIKEVFSDELEELCFKDREDLKGKIKMILNDETYYRELSKRCLNFAKTKYPINNTINNYHELLGSMFQQ